MELRNIPRFRPNDLTDLIDTLHGDTPIVHLDGNRYFDFIVGSSVGFPSELWRGLLALGSVHMLDHLGYKVNITALEQNDPELYHTLALSALRTMLTPIMFEPRGEIVELASKRASKLMSMRALQREHCVAVHLRWTDKKTDEGVAAKMNFTVDHVALALERLEHLTGRAYRCILLLSDDDEAAIPALRNLLGDAFTIRPISRVRELFASQADYDIYKQRGHTHVRDVFTSRNPALAYAYPREVFIDIQTALLTADYLIGPGSSGVSQLLAQYMGAYRHVDSNAVALWQEDILMVQA